MEKKERKKARKEERKKGRKEERKKGRKKRERKEERKKGKKKERKKERRKGKKERKKVERSIFLSLATLPQNVEVLNAKTQCMLVHKDQVKELQHNMQYMTSLAYTSCYFKHYVHKVLLVYT